MPTPPATPPQCPFTFSLPLPGSSPEAGITAKDFPRQSPSQEVEITGRPVQRIPNDSGFGLNLPSIPMTPTFAPKVRLPSTHPCESEDAHTQPEPFSLHDFTIPSPLLYHSKSREELLGVPGDIDISKSGKVVCGREPSDPNSKSFKLGTPLHLPCDDRQSRSFSDTRLNGIDDMDFHSTNDSAFYLHTRTYLKAPYERNKKCTIMAPPEFEAPIVTTTNTLRKRQTQIYPGEYALNPPITLPSSIGSAASLVIGVDDKPSPASADAVNPNESWSCNGEIYPNTDSATPSLERNGEQPLAISSETINNRCKGPRKRRGRVAKMTTSAPPNPPEITSEGDDTRDSLVDPVGSQRDEEIAWTSALNKSCTARPHTSKASAISSQLPVAVQTPFVPQPNPPAASPAAASSPVAYPASPLGNACADQTLDIIRLQACPTTTCTASLIVIPTTTRKLVSDRHHNKYSRLSSGRRDVERAAKKFAEELGLETEHGDGCPFDRKWKRCDEEGGVEGEGPTETGADLSSGEGYSPAAELVEEDGEDGLGCAFGERWDEEWVGEGEDADFWV